jgi:PLD-like domain
MTIDLKVFDNGDHTALVWLPKDASGNPMHIPNCCGFTVHRVLKPGGNQPAQDSYLHGFVGFSDADKLDPNAPWKFPVQRYMWSDYDVAIGDVVQYAVVPVTGSAGNLSLSNANASAMTPPMTITGQVSPHISAYFNKGIVSAQWVSRALTTIGKNAKLPDLIGQPGNALRNELSGLLRPQILKLLDDAKANNGEVYAALYELNDPELIQRLTALGQKCHLILGNGAFKPPTNDENQAVRRQLQGKIDLHNRLVPRGHFAHNKFLVVCDSSGNPQHVLSGSTNWTMTGLCTQANNGIIVDNPDLGAFFIKEWNLLKAAGNSYPPSLRQTNGKSATFNVDGGTVTQWFAPTDKGEDLDYARTLINGAQDGILFLFFNPGVFEPDNQPEMWTLLQNILVRHQEGSPNYNGALYIHGVVNQEIAGLTTEDTPKPKKGAALDPTQAAPVKLYGSGKTAPLAVPYESVVPAAIKNTFHNWVDEIMNQGVHVHSKVIVIDPFGKKPVVMTGSHNLGHKASTANDDNLMIVEGNAALAAAYAVNIITIYQTYRWNTYVDAHAKDPAVWHGLVDNDTWQDGYLKGDELSQTEFWLGEVTATAAPAAAPAAAAPAAGPPPARAATATGPSHSSRPGKPKAAASTTKKPAHKAAAKKPVKKPTKKPTKKPAKKPAERRAKK